jgi:hypothetical protein
MKYICQYIFIYIVNMTASIKRFLDDLYVCQDCLKNVVEELRNGNRFSLASIKFKGPISICPNYTSYCECTECECFENCQCSECEDTGCEQECKCECTCTERTKPFDARCECFIGEVYSLRCIHHKNKLKHGKELHNLKARIYSDDKTCVLRNSTRRSLLKFIDDKRDENSIYLDE